jgi:ferric-dicitrate binding protein FerR (iron transport regulator)
VTPTPEDYALLSAWCDGCADEDQVRRLDERLRTDPAFRRLYLAFMDQHATLELSGRAAPPSVTLPTERLRPRRRLFPRTDGAPTGIWIAAAAAAAVLSAVVYLFIPGAPAPASAKARPSPPARPEPAPPIAPEPPPRVAELREELRRAEEEARLAREAKEAERLRKAEAELADVARRFKEAQAAAPPLTPVQRSNPLESLQPPPASKSDPAPTRAAFAVVEGSGALRAGVPLRPGDPLFAGDDLEAAGPAALAFTDGTRLELAAGTRIAGMSEQPGRRLDIVQGALAADVKKQPAGRPLVLATPHGEATVLGTTLRLLVEPGRTRLDVTEGRVRLRRMPDGKSVDVSAGQFAVAAPGMELAAKPVPTRPAPLLAEAFQDAAAFNARWEVPRRFPGATLQLAGGRLDIALVPRQNRRVVGEAVTRAAYRLPLRVGGEVEWSHPQQIVGLSLMPPGDDNKDGILATFDGAGYGLSLGTGNWDWRALGADVASSGPWPRREAWTLEADESEVVLRVDGRELVRRRPGGRTLDGYHVRIEGTTAKPDLPRPNFVRWDNLFVEAPESGRPK